MTSSTVPKCILLAGDPICYELAAAAASALKPGMLARRNSAGTLEAHATAAGVALPIFVRELSLAGLSIDDVYEPGDVVPFYACKKGDHVYAFLKDEGNVAIGAQLESDGAGALQAVSGSHPCAIALEAVNNTGGSGPVRIRVEVI